ncbi:endonuclease/exonuclease/phosphatase family protein [Algibacter amylolyticus]|uniref:Endonuclease/exonuclease/phosphatase family protein n=1 Tax=Algibacter amylolyticus TaxID=1608400 RepID=A0A5M7B715_9FLAO|nr:endonuclease/exonuclease/phosphatase family protein [Algibacter amylolyticus]KAA5825109.1 endonuclease/exonuclease/phosphatase family protein [Algibacter amylolyticus]MBB5268784.1 endonuclease/exonuclease/phosphatase family metal-dependent hydrolase [Algibacter amylolyticus]TSJ77603.1 endonuclease/exonuclease/phosphatase family protein [Algibacter amylolyticus]
MKKLSFINKIIYLVNVVVAVLLLLSFVLPFLPPKTFSILAVVNLGVSFLIIINVVFFLYWVFRLKRQFMLSLVALLIGYFSFGSLYKFSSSVKVESPNNIKVMNYNVRLFNLYQWIPEKGVETKIVDFIKTEAPDVLSIQEYHPHKNIDLSFFKYKFEKLSGKKMKYGQVIFSKFPIINSGSIEFPDTANNAIFADVVKGKDTIRFYNIHLESLRIDTKVESLKKEDSERLFKRIGSTFKMQQFQTELFLMHKKQCKYKMVICGDFNNTAFSYVYRQIRGDLNDTFKEAGNGFGRTYDFKFFPVRIDFIFADQAFNVNGFKAYNAHYSDHYPITTTLSLE